MKNPLIRKILIVVIAIAIVALSVAINKYLAGKKAQTPKKPLRTEVRRVNTLKVENQLFKVTIPISGKVSAFRKVEIFSEVGGILMNTSDKFREGNTFKSGEQLIKIDDSELRQQIVSQRNSFVSRITKILADLKIDYPTQYNAWFDYLSAIDPEKTLPQLPNISDNRAKMFIVSQGIIDQFYQIKSQEARLQKYTLEAPFTGVITQSMVMPGALVRTGQKIGEFAALGKFEVAVDVSAALVGFIAIGDTACFELTNNTSKSALSKNAIFTVERIGKQINATTQTLQVYVTSADNRLIDGMYLSGTLMLSKQINGIKLDQNMVVDAERLFTLSPDSTLVLAQNVSVANGPSNSKIVSGLPNGQLLLIDRIPDAYSGMRVIPQINNPK